MLDNDEKTKEIKVDDKKTGEIVQFRPRVQPPATDQSVEPTYLEPIEVISYRRRNKRRISAWLSLPLKIIAACIVAFGLLSLPDFQIDLLVTWKNPVIVLLTVCYIGKSLFDTLFYDHYLP